LTNFCLIVSRQLQSYITQSNYTVTNFAYVFTEPGIYVFADAQSSQQLVVVDVLDSSKLWIRVRLDVMWKMKWFSFYILPRIMWLFSGTVCPPSRIQPMTAETLSQRGVAKQPVSNLSPDWTLIGGELA